MDPITQQMAVSGGILLLREILWLLAGGGQPAEPGQEPDPDNLRPPKRWADLEVFAAGTDARRQADVAVALANVHDPYAALWRAKEALTVAGSAQAGRLASMVGDAYSISPAFAKSVLDLAEEVLV